MINVYDPNIRWATTTVEITYMYWDYSLKVQIEVGGNCRGMSILNAAVERHAEELYDAQGEYPLLFLTKPAEDGTGEDTLECSDEEDDIEEWLNNLCVGVEIISHIPKVTK